MNKDAPYILVTGGAGLIGSAVVRDLARDHRVIAVDVKQPDDLPPGAEFIHCDLTDDRSVEAMLAQARQRSGGHLTAVVHLAAHYDFSGLPSPLYQELTVDGTRRLIRGLQSFERVEQLIFSSSLLVMKPADEQAETLTEASPTRPAWAYPQSKLDAEQVLRQEQGKAPVVVLRIAGVYTDEGSSLPIGQHIRRIHTKSVESFLFPGDKRHGQPFVHLCDLVRCIRQTIARRAALSDWELFLIAEPDVMSHDELQDAIGELLHGAEWPTIRVPKAVAKAGAWVKDTLGGDEQFIKPWMIDLADDHYPVEIERARQRLGWNPERRLRDTLPNIIRCLKQDPAAWYDKNKLPPPDFVEREPTFTEQRAAAR